jgi:uncharacterized membrane protein YccC
MNPELMQALDRLGHALVVFAILVAAVLVFVLARSAPARPRQQLRRTHRERKRQAQRLRSLRDYDRTRKVSNG